MEFKSDDTLHEVHRSAVRTGLRLARLLDRHDLPAVTDGEVDAVVACGSPVGHDGSR